MKINIRTYTFATYPAVHFSKTFQLLLQSMYLHQKKCLQRRFKKDIKFYFIWLKQKLRNPWFSRNDMNQKRSCNWMKKEEMKEIDRKKEILFGAIRDDKRVVTIRCIQSFFFILFCSVYQHSSPNQTIHQ